MADPNQPQTAKPFAGLGIARVVHFVMADGPGRGKHRPAFITGIIDADKGIVNLQIFRDAEDGAVTMATPSFIVPKVKHSPDGAEATWHWPERVD
jgi:hypothetical protein